MCGHIYYSNSLTHIYKHTHADVHIDTDIHRHAHTHTHTHERTHAHTHAQHMIHACITCICAYMYKHIHRHTCIVVYICNKSLSKTEHCGRLNEWIIRETHVLYGPGTVDKIIRVMFSVQKAFLKIVYT